MDDHVVDLAGKELGGYRLLHQLGAGGGGVVYLAQRLDQPAALFAIKVLDPSAILDPRIRATLSARFLREAEAVKRLHHPHILSVLAAGEQDGYLYMALPFMRGGDLAARIGAFPRGMPLAEVNADLAQIAGALDEAHHQGIIHRDIKPTNILLDERGQLYLADFGIARLLANDGSGGPTPATLTATGQTLGTPQYMAPEQVTGQRVGPAADIYALGVVLYQMVTGTPPFTGDTPFAIAMKHAQEAPPPLRPQRADLPPAAETAILRALAKRPEDRYATASELAQAFSAGLQTLQPATPATLMAAAPTPTVMTPQAAGPRTQGIHGAASDSGASTQPWMPNGAQFGYPHPAQPAPKPPHAAWAIAAAILVLAVVIAAVGYGAVTHFAQANTPATTNLVGDSSQAGPTATLAVSATSTPYSAAPTATLSNTNQWATPAIAAGPLIYETHAGGDCDQQGATWASNGMATQSCQNNALVMSAQQCNCAIGVSTLGSLPATPYPTNYIAQVTANILGGASTAKFGFKFRQQSVGDTGQGRGGYSFLVDPNGQWQFNEYDADGTRHILVQRQLPSALSGVHTLDVVVSGSDYSFYLDGNLINQSQDMTYSSGYLCLAIEPGATIAYSDFSLYSST